MEPHHSRQHTRTWRTPSETRQAQEHQSHVVSLTAKYLIQLTQKQRRKGPNQGGGEEDGEMLAYEYRTSGLGKWLMGKVLGVKAWGPGFGSLTSTYKTRHGADAYNPTARKWRQAGPRIHLSANSPERSSSRFSKRPSQGKVNSHRGDNWSPPLASMCVHICAHNDKIKSKLKKKNTRLQPWLITPRNYLTAWRPQLIMCYVFENADTRVNVLIQK